MAGEQSDVQVHVRFRGRVFGPYSLGELRNLMRKGKSTTSWEISLDTRNWRPIQELETLLQQNFGLATADHLSPSSSGPPMGDEYLSEDVLHAGGVQGDGGKVISPPTQRKEGVKAEVAEEAGLWYYALNDQPQGPLPETQLAAMVANGTLSPGTLVWTLNMSEWCPVRETRLARYLPAGTKTSQPAVQPRLDEPPVETSVPHLKRSFAEELEAVLAEETGHLRFWFGVLLVAAIVKVIVSVLALFIGGGVFSLLCDMVIAAALIGISMLVLQIVSRLRLGDRFLTRPKKLGELYPMEQQKHSESPWSYPVGEGEL
ncbi:MAG: DUF4339 domain-containing protein [Thermogutta sp.]